MAKNIEVTLTLDTKKFSGNLKRAETQMKGFGGQANMTKGSIMGLAARFAPLAAGLVAVTAGFKGISASVGAARKIEDIGVVMKNIVGSAEGGAIALQKVRDVAQELPFDFEAIAGATPALATVSKDINELEQNTRLAADIAATTGLSFEDAASQLQRAFSGGAGAADMFREKGVLAMAGFEAGASYSIDETRAKLREFGTSVEGAAVALNDTFSGAVSQTQDRLFDMQASMGEAIIPEFKTFLSSLVAIYDKNKEAIQGFAKAVGQGVVEGFYAFLQVGAVVVDFMTMLFGIFKSVAAFIQDNFGEVIGKVMDFAVRAIAGVVEAVAFLGAGIGKLVSFTTGNDSMQKYFENIEAAANKARTGGIEQVKVALGDMANAVPERGAQDFVAQLIGDMRAAGIASDEEAAKMKERLQDINDAGATIIQNGAKDLTASLSDYASSQETLLKTFGDATKTLSTDMATALMDGKDVLGSFKSFFKKIIGQIISEALRLMVIQPILTSIFGAFGSTLSFSSSGAPSIAGKAMGGPVMKNKPYIVGERGPELMVPSTNGNIIPNNQLGMGGTERTMVTYNINAVDARSFKQLVAQDPEFMYTVTQAGARRVPR